MRRFRFVLAAAVASVAAGSAPTRAQIPDGQQPTAAFRLRLRAARDTTLALADLQRLARGRARVIEHSHGADSAMAAEYEGVALGEVLRLAGVDLGPPLRGRRAAASYVLVEAADGYRVVFSLAEADPARAGGAVLVADRRAGRPLGAGDGPLRIVAPGEPHSRWARQVVAISVREAAP